MQVFILFKKNTQNNYKKITFLTSKHKNNENFFNDKI